MFVTIPLCAVDKTMARRLSQQIAEHAIWLQQQERWAVEDEDYETSFSLWLTCLDLWDAVQILAERSGDAFFVRGLQITATR